MIGDDAAKVFVTVEDETHAEVEAVDVLSLFVARDEFDDVGVALFKDAMVKGELCWAS